MNPGSGNLFIIEGAGVSGDVRRADAGGFTDTEEVYKGKAGQAGDADICRGTGPVNEKDEEISVGPKLWWWWGRE